MFGKIKIQFTIVRWASDVIEGSPYIPVADQPGTTGGGAGGGGGGVAGGGDGGHACLLGVPDGGRGVLRPRPVSRAEHRRSAHLHRLRRLARTLVRVCNDHWCKQGIL